MMDALRSSSGIRYPRSWRAWLGCLFMFGALAACRPAELTEEEKAFYRRVGEIKVGASIDQVKRLLGEPSKIVNAERDCLRHGAQKELIYQNFESAEGRKDLHDGAFVFCASADGKVMQVLEVVY